MLESVTKRRKNPVINAFGWTLLGVVCLVFIFTGFSPDASMLGSGGAAAEVNNDAISLRDYKELLDRLDSDKQTATDRESRINLQKDAINILVSQSLIVQEAQKLNIHVSDQEVAKELMDIEPFYEDGVFSKLRYKTYLRQARLTESEFEEKIRRNLIIQKMSNLIGFAAKDVEIMDQFEDTIDQAQVNIAYVALKAEGFKQNPSQAELNEFLQKNNAEIEAYFKTHKSEFTTEEAVKARHILIKSEPGKEEQALTKAKEVASKLNVKNFAEIAKKHSDDPGSKATGGDLGYFSRGRMVPDFERVAFSAEKGTISEPVKTQFGYHLILVEDKRNASEKTLDEVRLPIAQKIIARQQFDKVLADIKQMLADKKFDQVEKVLEQHKVNWNTTGFFSITNENIPGLGPNKEFLDLALSLGVDNEYAGTVLQKEEDAYLLKFKGARIDRSAKNNGQMDFFKQLMKQQKMNMMVQGWADSLRTNASVKINPELLR